jgi:hypothetical protein
MPKRAPTVSASNRSVAKSQLCRPRRRERVSLRTPARVAHSVSDRPKARARLVRAATVCAKGVVDLFINHIVLFVDLKVNKRGLTKNRTNVEIEHRPQPTLQHLRRMPLATTGWNGSVTKWDSACLHVHLASFSCSLVACRARSRRRLAMPPAFALCPPPDPSLLQKEALLRR